MPDTVRMAFLSRFECLGDKCEDTCCKGWGMQLDAATRSRYEKEAPQLLSAVDTGEAEWIMRRDPSTDYCVKFDQGLCGIHKQYGTEFLGDACHFFPRITRALGQGVVQSASLSCPEVARLALLQDGAFEIESAAFDRVPHSIRDYLPDGLDTQQAQAVHKAFLDAALEPTITPQRALSRIISVAQSLPAIEVKIWPAAVPFYLKSADARLPAPEANINDPFNLLHALMGLVSAAKKTARPRLMEVIDNTAQALGVVLDWQSVAIHTAPDSAARYAAMEQHWKTIEAQMQPVLRRWIAAQLSMALFPFSGFGATVYERAAILAVRFSTLRLAMMAHAQIHGSPPTGEQAVFLAQSLSRFLDHLADPELTLAIMKETGWVRESRLRALLKDE